MIDDEGRPAGWVRTLRRPLGREDEILLDAEALERGGAEATDVEATPDGLRAHGLFSSPTPERWALPPAVRRPIPSLERLPVRLGGLELGPGAGPGRLALDAGGAFGCGLHPTTAMMLALGARRAAPRILDVGTGSGVLAVAQLLVQPGAVAVATDVAPVALAAARANAVRNGVAGRITLSGELPEAGRFDLVLANLRTFVLAELAETLAGLLAPRGRLLASGVRFAEGPELEGRLAAAGLRAGTRWLHSGWWCLELERCAPDRTR